MKERDEAYKIASQSKVPALKPDFFSFRSDVTNALDTAKNNYIGTILSKSPTVSKRWQQLRSIRSLKKQPPFASAFFPLSTLNTHFFLVTNRHLSLIPSDLQEIFNSPIPLNLNGRPFLFKVVTETQVLSALNSTYSNSSQDHISTGMLKLSSPSIISHLTALFKCLFFIFQFPVNLEK